MKRGLYIRPGFSAALIAAAAAYSLDVPITKFSNVNFSLNEEGVSFSSNCLFSLFIIFS